MNKLARRVRRRRAAGRRAADRRRDDDGGAQGREPPAAASASADATRLPARRATTPTTPISRTKLITTGIVVQHGAPMKPTRRGPTSRGPSAQGQLIMPSPLYSGAAAIHWARSRASRALGWPFFEKLAKAATPSRRAATAPCSRRWPAAQKLYGVLVDFMAIRAQAKGSPVDFVFPARGRDRPSPSRSRSSKSTTQRAGGARVRRLHPRPRGPEARREQGLIPARPDGRPPPGFPPLTTIKLMRPTSPRSSPPTSANKKRFAELFGALSRRDRCERMIAARRPRRRERRPRCWAPGRARRPGLDLAARAAGVGGARARPGVLDLDAAAPRADHAARPGRAWRTLDTALCGTAAVAAARRRRRADRRADRHARARPR